MMNTQGNPMVALSQNSPVTQPMPRRRWWLWRIAVVYMLFFAGVVLLSYAAARVAQGRLDADIRALRAKGQPVLMEDFAEPVLLDEENAATYLGRAAAVFEKMSDEDASDFDGLPTMLPLTPAQVELMAKLTAKHAEVLKDAHIARTKAGVNWKMQLRSPAIGVLLPWLSPQRHLSQFLRSAALYAHQQGDDAAAVEYVRDLLAMGRACDQSPFLVCHLVAMGIVAEGSSTLMRIMPDLRIAEGDRPAAPGEKPVAPIQQKPGFETGARPATRGQVEALLAELLDERPTREGFVRSLQGERLFQIDTAMCIAGGSLNLNIVSSPPTPETPRSLLTQLSARTVRPLMLNETRAMLAWSSQMVEAAEQADLPATTARMPAMPVQSFRHPLLSVLVPALNTAATRHYTNMYQMRKVTMGLAGRLYEIDHGAAAERVEELVPRYLPGIPLDPLKGGGATMPFGPTMQATTKAVGGR